MNQAKIIRPHPKNGFQVAGAVFNWVNEKGFKAPAELASETVKSQATGVEIDLLRHIGTAASTYPADVTVHPNLAKILYASLLTIRKVREKTIAQGEGIDWATAESMGFGTLLSEGNHVRLSGQDVERGTFSQRHAVLNDQKNVRDGI